jgi:hypothetical protein
VYADSTMEERSSPRKSLDTSGSSFTPRDALQRTGRGSPVGLVDLGGRGVLARTAVKSTTLRWGSGHAAEAVDLAL